MLISIPAQGLFHHAVRVTVFAGSNFFVISSANLLCSRAASMNQSFANSGAILNEHLQLNSKSIGPP